MAKNVIVIKVSQSLKTKCTCCKGIIPTTERYSYVNGEKYCHHTDCHTKYLYLNNPDATSIDNPADDDCERFLQSMEDYASYQAGGCVSEYWNDRDNGYAY